MIKKVDFIIYLIIIQKSYMNELNNKDNINKIMKLFSVGAHQLKSPMNSVFSILDAILYSYKDQLPEKVHKLLSSALNKSDDLNKLVKDLLQLGKLDESSKNIKPSELEVFISKIDQYRSIHS